MKQVPPWSREVKQGTNACPLFRETAKVCGIGESVKRQEAGSSGVERCSREVEEGREGQRDLNIRTKKKGKIDDIYCFVHEKKAGEKMYHAQKGEERDGPNKKKIMEKGHCWDRNSRGKSRSLNSTGARRPVWICVAKGEKHGRSRERRRGGGGERVSWKKEPFDTNRLQNGMCPGRRGTETELTRGSEKERRGEVHDIVPVDLEGKC